MAAKSGSKLGSRICSRNYCKRASQEQKIGLVEFLEKHRDCILSPDNGLLKDKASYAKWEEITKLLNNYEEGAYKDASQWRRYWLDTRKQVRKKFMTMSMKEEKNEKLANHEIITDLDARINNLMNEVSMISKEKIDIFESTEDEGSEIDDNKSQSISTLRDDDISVKSEFYIAEIKKRKRSDEEIYCEEFPITHSNATKKPRNKVREKEQATPDKEQTNQNKKSETEPDFLKMKLAIEKDRIRALTDISSSIRYLADVIRSVMTNSNVKNNSINKTEYST